MTKLFALQIIVTFAFVMMTQLSIRFVYSSGPTALSSAVTVGPMFSRYQSDNPFVA